MHCAEESSVAFLLPCMTCSFLLVCYPWCCSWTNRFFFTWKAGISWNSCKILITHNRRQCFFSSRVFASVHFPYRYALLKRHAYPNLPSDCSWDGWNGLKRKKDIGCALMGQGSGPRAKVKKFMYSPEKLHGWGLPRWVFFRAMFCSWAPVLDTSLDPFSFQGG